MKRVFEETARDEVYSTRGFDRMRAVASLFSSVIANANTQIEMTADVFCIEAQ